MDTAAEESPLSGVRVIDISHHMAGPTSTQKLGDLGADVVKIEPPGTGEWTRTRPIANAWVGDMNTSLIAMNRNKRSLTLNLKHPDGYAVLVDLIKDADVFVENFRPEVCKRLKVDYESLSAINPRLIYCAITGYGDDGPLHLRPGQDLILQAFSGVTWSAGRVGDPPVPMGTFVADATTANHAVIGILGALLARERTGKGQKISVNLLNSLMDVQLQEFTTYLNTGILPARSEERLAHPFINSPYGIHHTKDGFIAIAMTPFDLLADALECEELKRFTDWSAGYTHRDEIFRLTTAALLKRTTAEWIERLDGFNVWSGPVQTYAEVAEHPQVKHNGIVREIEHPDLGTLRVMNFPVAFSGTPATIRRLPPRLGEHNEEILSGLGKSSQEIEALRTTGAI